MYVCVSEMEQDSQNIELCPGLQIQQQSSYIMN